MKKILFATSLLMAMGFSHVYAQSNLSLYNCNAVSVSVPPNPPGMTYPYPGYLDLTICGSSLEYAQQLANNSLRQYSINGWQVVGQCSLLRPSFPQCTAPGRI